jgi:hypothetical protein
MRQKRADSSSALRRVREEEKKGQKVFLHLFWQTISASSLSGSGSMESSIDSKDSDSMQERLKRDELNLKRNSSNAPPLGKSLTRNPSVDSIPTIKFPLRPSSGLKPNEEVPVAVVETQSAETSPIMSRRSLKMSGEKVLSFFGIQRKGSSGGSAILPPARQIVGNFLVGKKSSTQFVQRSVRQEDCRLLIRRLNTNMLDFVIDLSRISRIEPRQESEDFDSIAISFGKNDLVLISTGKKEKNDELRATLTHWARFFNQDVLASPRGSPRCGNLRGYLFLPKRNHRVWASQTNGDVLCFYYERARNMIGKIDMSCICSAEYNRLALEITMVEMGDGKSHKIICENEENFIYWKGAVSMYCKVKSPPVARSQKIELNFGNEKL